MTKYTPFTGEVRDVYSIHCEGWCERCGDSDLSSFEFHEVEFNRWLIDERIRVAKMATEKALNELIGYDDIRKLRYHHPTDQSVGGILAVCSCGQPIDDFIKHIKEQK